jgi:hypothetical protein
MTTERCEDCDWCVCNREGNGYICALNKQALKKDARESPCTTGEWSQKWKNYHNRKV